MKFGAFCETVILQAKSSLDTFAGTANLVRILLIIAMILGYSVIVFVALAALLAIGAIGYFGSIGALIAANPWLAAILLTIGTAGLWKTVSVLYEERRVVAVVKRVIVDRYESDFSHQVATININHPDITSSHLTAIDELVYKASVDLLNALQSIGKIDEKKLRVALGSLAAGR